MTTLLSCLLCNGSFQSSPTEENLSNLLPCGHTFHKICLSKNLSDPTTKSKCPKCSCVFLVPLSSLPTNPIFVNYLKNLETSDDDTAKVFCGECKEIAEFFCVDCEGKDPKSCLCTSCHNNTNTHKDHNILPKNQYLSLVKEKIQKNLEESKDIHQKMDEISKILGNTTEQFEDSILSSEKKIDEETEKLIQSIKKRQEELKVELKKVIQQRQNFLKDARNDVAILMSHAIVLEDTLVKSLDKGPDGVILAKSKLQPKSDKLRGLSQKVEEYKQWTGPLTLLNPTFPWSNELNSSIQTFGTITGPLVPHITQCEGVPNGIYVEWHYLPTPNVNFQNFEFQISEWTCPNTTPKQLMLTRVPPENVHFLFVLKEENIRYSFRMRVIGKDCVSNWSNEVLGKIKK